MTTACERFWWLALSLLLAQASISAALGAETIYALAADDGTILLSNVPTGRGYKPLVSDAITGRAVSIARDWPPIKLDHAAKARYEGLVEQTAVAFGLDSALLHAVISVESGYNPSARSSKGAAGLMQLMPATAKRYQVANALDPAQNLEGGAKYLRDLLKLFDRDLNLVLAAYNAGESAVAKHGNRIPPYRETVDYVPRVLAYYRKYQAD